MSLRDPEGPNPYELLGLEPDASEAAVKTAYRKRSLAVHPDRNPDNAEAAQKFHELNTAYNLLLDPTKKAALDEAFRAQRARKERFATFDAKRRNLQEDLESRERAFKRARVDKLEEERKREQDIERVKEEGRRKMREREEAAARRNATPPPPAAATSASSQPTLGPLDTTVRVKYSLSAHPNLSTAAAVESLLSQFGALDTPVLALKARKSKKAASSSSDAVQATAVVHFDRIEHAHAAVCASNDKKRGFEGIEITWAGGAEPAILAQLKSQWSAASASTETSKPPSVAPVSASIAAPAGTGGGEDDILARLRAFSSQPSTTATPDFTSTKSTTTTAPASDSSGLDVESVTLLRMRAMERAKLEAQIRDEEAMES